MILYGNVDDWLSWENHVNSLSLVEFCENSWRSGKLETNDGNSFGNLHASRKLKVIFLGALLPHLLNLLDSPFPFLLLPGHPQATFLKTLATRANAIKPGIVELFVALLAEVVTLVLEDCPFCQLIGATLNLALNTLLAESFSIRSVNPIVGVDISKTGRALFYTSPLTHNFPCGWVSDW